MHEGGGRWVDSNKLVELKNIYIQKKKFGIAGPSRPLLSFPGWGSLRWEAAQACYTPDIPEPSSAAWKVQEKDHVIRESLKEKTELIV